MSKGNVEEIKLESKGLGGALASELRNDENHFSDAGKTLLKFHGVYEQHDREKRGRNKDYSFMIRTKVPGGQLTAEQYLAHDTLADKYANGTLRITTRQCFQFHGVIKTDLYNTIHELNDAFVTTLGACGDIVRNVMACPAPTADPQRKAVQDYALHLTEALFPRTRSYHQIWIDGEEIINDEVIGEPLYGQTYLPRKFKIAVAFPGDNCVDVFTNDAGLVAIFDEDGTLAGFNVLAGGGMGMTHNNDETFPRLADVIGFVTPDQAVATIAAIVTIHRDFGDRTNRKHARLKYILHEWGVETFRIELNQRLGFEIQPARAMPAFEVLDHMGWNEQGDGLLYLGIPVENGRVADRGDNRLRSGLRAIIEQFNLSVRLTPQQSILLTNIQPQDRPAIDNLLREYQIRTVEEISQIRRYALACPAMPTCGLAITEAERAFPHVIDEFESLLAEIGLGDNEIVMRMTGCPNGCARPYVAEIGFVGRSLDKYTIMIGGRFNGTRLAEEFIDLVHLDALAETLRPALTLYRDERQEGERFGDFAYRVGLDRLRAVAQPVELSAD